MKLKITHTTTVLNFLSQSDACPFIILLCILISVYTSLVCILRDNFIDLSYIQQVMREPNSQRSLSSFNFFAYFCLSIRSLQKFLLY